MAPSCLIIVASVVMAVAGHVPANLEKYVWPRQWHAIQEINMVSGNFSGALQRGLVAYDFDRLLTREDQVLISGPSVKTGFTSNNMTEWFHNMTWYYMDWTTGECMSNEWGWGQVKRDFLVNNDFPKQVGQHFIYAYSENSTAGGKREFVNTSWIQTDGSSGFGSPPGSSLFEWYVDESGIARRMRMPSSLSSDLVIDLLGFRPDVDSAMFELPPACNASLVRTWLHGPITPLAQRFERLSAQAFQKVLV
jgi:hypothetical protein